MALDLLLADFARVLVMSFVPAATLIRSATSSVLLLRDQAAGGWKQSQRTTAILEAACGEAATMT